MSTVKFLGKEFTYLKYPHGESFTLNGSCLSIYYQNYSVLVYLGKYAIFHYNASVDLKNFEQEVPSVIVQKVLDSNQEIILKKIAEQIAEFSKIASLTQDEFGKVLIFV